MKQVAQKFFKKAAELNDSQTWEPVCKWKYKTFNLNISTNFFYVEGGQELEQVPHRGCGVPVYFGDIQKLTANGPEQAGLDDPALSRGLGWTISRGPFQPQSLCHSVNRRST